MITVAEHDGRATKIYPLEKETSLSKKKESVFWIRIVSPTEEDVSLVAKKTRMNKKYLRECLELEESGPSVFLGATIKLVYSLPTRKQEKRIAQLFLYAKKRFIVTAETRPIPLLENTMELAGKTGAKFLFANPPVGFIHYIVDKTNDEFLHEITRIGGIIDQIEKRAMHIDTKILESLYHQSVLLSEYNRALLGNLEVLNALKKTPCRLISDDDRESFGVDHAELGRTLDALTIQRDTIAALFNLQSGLASHRLSEVTKKLTAIASIIMVPTVVSGLYGMNFEHIPLAGHPYGFYIVTGVTLASLVPIYLLLKKAGMA